MAANSTTPVDTSYTPAIGFAYTSIVFMAALPIYIGSYLSLNKRKGVRSTNRYFVSPTTTTHWHLLLILIIYWSCR